MELSFRLRVVHLPIGQVPWRWYNWTSPMEMVLRKEQLLLPLGNAAIRPLPTLPQPIVEGRERGQPEAE